VLSSRPARYEIVPRQSKLKSADPPISTLLNRKSSAISITARLGYVRGPQKRREARPIRESEISNLKFEIAAESSTFVNHLKPRMWTITKKR
jgi:hypothetical protein